MSKKDREAQQARDAAEADRTTRRNAAMVLVRWDEVAEPKKSEIAALWDERERRARELRDIRGDKPRNDAYAVPTEGETLGRGAMVRGKDEPAPKPKKVQGEFLQVVPAESPDATVTDGTTDDAGRVDIGTFVKGPEKKENRF
jgi:hypothetical protein